MVLKILVTGSSGYIGSNFINYFSNKYSFIRFSLLKSPLNSIDFANIDTVLHCAALVHQKMGIPYKEYLEVNVNYPILLAKKAKESGVKQFVFISTVAVYGEENRLLKESTVCKPETSYGKSKFEAEKLLQELENDNFIVSIIRPPMVYGEDAPGNIEALVKLVKKIPLLPFGKIGNRRSFVYIGNLCHLIDAVLEKRQSGVFLASDDKPLSTTRLIELISDALGKKVYLVKIPFFEALLKMLKPSLHKKLYESLEVDNSSTKEVLGLKDPYDIEDGIRLMIHGTDDLNFRLSSE